MATKPTEPKDKNHPTMLPARIVPRLISGAGVLAVSVLGLVLLPSTPATAADISDEACTKNAETVQVPSGVTAVAMYAVGGHGGTEENSAEGGRGGWVQATLAVNPGDVLTYGVGCYGEGHGGWGYLDSSGGKHGVANSDLSYDGGPGGGATVIEHNGEIVVVAGGGGGGGGEAAMVDGSGKGGDGGLPPQDGHNGSGGASRHSSGGCGGCASGMAGTPGGGSSTHSAGGGGGGGGGYSGGEGGEGGNDFAGHGAGGGGGLSWAADDVSGLVTGVSDRTHHGLVTFTWTQSTPEERIEDPEDEEIAAPVDSTPDSADAAGDAHILGEDTTEGPMTSGRDTTSTLPATGFADGLVGAAFALLIAGVASVISARRQRSRRSRA